MFKQFVLRAAIPLCAIILSPILWLALRTGGLRRPEPPRLDRTSYGYRLVGFQGNTSETGLPPGLTLNSGTGKISGTPTVAGTYLFTITVSNSAGSASKQFSLTVNPNPATTFPAVISTPQTLFQASDHAHTTLAADLTSSGTTISVADGSTFVADEVIRIDNELMELCAASSATLTVCAGQRGIGGTAAAAHSNTTAVDGRISAIYGNTLNARLIDLELWAASHNLGHYGCPTGPGGFTSGASWPCKVVTLNDLGTDVDGQPLTVATYKRRILELTAFEADIFGTIGSTLGHTGTCGTCPSQPNSSWPSRPAVTSDFPTATPGATITHAFHNRVVSEIIGLETDIHDNP